MGGTDEEGTLVRRRGLGDIEICCKKNWTKLPMNNTFKGDKAVQ